MLIALTAVAIVLGLGVSWGIVMIAYLVRCVVLTPLAILALFDRGDRQAFAIGALIPWLATSQFGSFVAHTIWLLVLGAVCGAIAVVTRRWIASQKA
jgi:hypothetical protein